MPRYSPEALENRRAYCRKYYRKNHKAELARARANYKIWKSGIRDQVFGEVLSPVCECCGESNKHFLCIDHVFNDGAKERRQNKGAGIVLGRRLVLKAADKSRYQTLCYNCNMGKQFGPVKGTCPHKLNATKVA